MKGGAVGRTRFLILFLEIFAIWLIYTLFHWLTAADMPIWLTSLLVILTDRSVGVVSDIAKSGGTRFRLGFRPPGG